MQQYWYLNTKESTVDCQESNQIAYAVAFYFLHIYERTM